MTALPVHQDTHSNHGFVDEHAALLTSKAIALDVAATEGVKSITSIEQMPEDLRWVFKRERKCDHKSDLLRCTAPAGFGPGILYTWRDLAGDESPQFNPTWGTCEAHGEKWLPVNKDNEPTKYLFESGKPAKIWVAKMMIEHIKTAKFIVFVEGTKQYLAVCSALRNETDWLAVGVAGCQNWQSGGMPNADIDELAGEFDWAAVAFDSDVLTNEDVYNAGKGLDVVLSAATGQVGRYVRVPGGVTKAENGIDDWLGASVKTDERRTKALLNLLNSKEQTKKLPANFPGKRKRPQNIDDELTEMANAPKTGSAVLHIDAGYVKVPDTVTYDKNGNRQVKEGRVVAGFVPRIVRSYVVGDLHNVADRDVFHDVEVTQDGRTYEGTSVPDSQLADRKGFERMLRSIGMTAPEWVSEPYAHSQVVAAMYHDAKTNAEQGEAMSHTGWWDHPELGPVFLMPTGAICAEGLITERKTMFERGSNRSKIDLSALADATEGEVRAAVETMNETMDCFDPRHQVFPLLAISQIAVAGSGIMSRGTPFVLGLPESGKSVTVECYSTCYGRGIDPEVMVDQTGRKAVTLGYGLSNIMICADDIKTAEADPEAYKSTVKGVYGNVRRGYDGGKAGSSSMQMSDTSRTGWAPGSPEQTDPTLFMTGEIVPPELDASTYQRMFIHEHKTEHLINGARLAEITEEGLLSLAHAAYVQFIAQSIVGAGGMRLWTKSLRDQATAFVATYRPRYNGSKRTAQVLAHRLVGISLWASFCISVGVWTETEADEWEKESTATLEKAMDWHYENYGSGASAKSKRWILDAIKSAVTGSPRWYIAASLAAGIKAVEHRDGHVIERRTMVGCEHSAEGTEYVALKADEVANALGLKVRNVEVALKEIAEPREVKGTKRYTRPINQAGHSVSMYWIPKAVWDLEADEPNLPDNVTPLAPKAAS